MTSQPATWAGSTRRAWLLAAAGVGPAAWALTFNVGYGVAALSCSRGLAHREAILHALNAGALALALLGLAVCGGALRQAEPPYAHSGLYRFLAALGVAANLLAIVLVVFGAVPVFVLDGCGAARQ